MLKTFIFWWQNVCSKRLLLALVMGKAVNVSVRQRLVMWCFSVSELFFLVLSEYVWLSWLLVMIWMRCLSGSIGRECIRMVLNFLCFGYIMIRLVILYVSYIRLSEMKWTRVLCMIKLICFFFFLTELFPYLLCC